MAYIRNTALIKQTYLLNHLLAKSKEELVMVEVQQVQNLVR